MIRLIIWTCVMTGLAHSFIAAEPKLIRDFDKAQRTSPKGLFSFSYRLADPSFCYASCCVDVDNDGRRDLFFASRGTKHLTRLDAQSGNIVWSKPFVGEQQSLSAFDVDQDGDFEILYTTSSPGRLNIVDHTGEVVRFWETTDWKIGNSPVILDADGNGKLDAIFGTRADSLVRLDLASFQEIARHIEWSQCGCHTSALDVDHDGTWDFFAGSGDDFGLKGRLYRFDPTLEIRWRHDTNDNASSADAVLVDLDGDGTVEILKSVDNYKGDDNHEALVAYSVDGEKLWSVPGIAEEDSPNAADLDGDGEIEIIGMTFGGEVYCLNAKGETLWRKDLRPELDDGTHMYMTPILCDLNGDEQLEILAMTNGTYFETEVQQQSKPHAILFALNAKGEILDQFDLGSARYFGEAFACQSARGENLSIVLSGSGGMDVIETKGKGPNSEYFQRRRTYQRLNVVQWAYEETYFLYRGEKEDVQNGTDNLILKKIGKNDEGEPLYAPQGHFISEPLDVPPGCEFTTLTYEVDTPEGTNCKVSLIDEARKVILDNVKPDQKLENVGSTVRVLFELSTDDELKTPRFDGYRLEFWKRAE
ncbi:MAG: FG-GAP-like repeat-containing protein [Planctomycetaceae bacterium]